MADTCQAATLAKHFYAPGASLPRSMRTLRREIAEFHAASLAGVLAIGSSALGEPSWSFAQDSRVGLSLVDRFTHFCLLFLERVGPASEATLHQLFATLDRAKLHSTAVPRTDLFRRRLRDVRITDFFGARASV